MVEADFYRINWLDTSNSFTKVTCCSIVVQVTLTNYCFKETSLEKIYFYSDSVEVYEVAILKQLTELF